MIKFLSRALTVGIVLAGMATAGGAAPHPRLQHKNTAKVDLVQIQLVLPGKVKIGKTFQVLDELENAGTALSFECLTLFFLSKDDKFDETDVLVGGRRAPQLGAGQSHSMQSAVTIKPIIEPGTYYFLAVADGKREIEERYKDNNVRALKITVQPADPPKQVS